MKTHWKIPIVCLQLLLVLGLLLGTPAPVKADQFEEGLAAFSAGNHQKAFGIFKSLAEQGHRQAPPKIHPQEPFSGPEIDDLCPAHRAGYPARNASHSASQSGKNDLSIKIITLKTTYFGFTKTSSRSR